MKSLAQTEADRKQKELNAFQDKYIDEMTAKILKLEIENANMRDRLINRGDGEWLKTLAYDTPNNMELGKKVRSIVNGENN